MSRLFDHDHLRVYQEAIGFVAWLEDAVPHSLRSVCACDHLARASAGVPVSIAEASGKWSVNERCQYLDTAYGSCLECATCLDILSVRGCLTTAIALEGKQHLSTIVSMVIGFRQSAGGEMREEDAPYETGNQDGVRVWFDHEKLDVYRNALDFVGWCAEMERNGRIVRWAQTALDKTSTGIALNIAEGNGKFSMKDRCRFIGYARTAALQAAATLDVLTARDSALELNVVEGKTLLVDAVRMLVAWQKSLSRSRSG